MTIIEMTGGPEIAEAMTADEGKKPFHQAPLQYAFNALEPVISEATLRWLYEDEHASHLKRLNKCARHLGIDGLSLEDLLEKASDYPAAIRECGGAHWNFTFFWQVLTDEKEDQEISTELKSRLDSVFGNLENFKTEFAKRAASFESSGWIWLIQTPQRELKILTTSNFDNPLMDNTDVRGTPLLVCYLWEASQSPNHQSFNREECVKRFFALVNWSRMHRLLIGGTH